VKAFRNIADDDAAAPLDPSLAKTTSDDSEDKIKFTVRRIGICPTASSSGTIAPACDAAG
jgi:hypothetical protein